MRNSKTWKRRLRKSKTKIKKSSRRFIGNAISRRRLRRRLMSVERDPLYTMRRRRSPSCRRKAGCPWMIVTSQTRASTSLDRKSLHNNKGTASSPTSTYCSKRTFLKVCSTRGMMLKVISWRKNIRKYRASSIKNQIPDNSYKTSFNSSKEVSRCNNPTRHIIT